MLKKLFKPEKNKLSNHFQSNGVESNDVDKNDPVSEPENKNPMVSKSVNERPRICLFDVEQEIIQTLIVHQYNCKDGTLGSLINVPNSSNRGDSSHNVIPNFNIPSNIHEYDIVIVDLQNSSSKPYQEEEHIPKNIKEDETIVFLSSFPQTVFDPRAFASFVLEYQLKEFYEKNSILIVFADAEELINYQTLKITRGDHYTSDSFSRSTYSLFPIRPSSTNLSGEDTHVVYDGNIDLQSLLERHNNHAKYTITFSHPTKYINGESKKSESFFPLMEGRPGDVVAYAQINDGLMIFVFPFFEEKGIFLLDLLEKVLPGIDPKLFPYSTRFAWLSFPEYRLPNESDLLEERGQLQSDFDINMAAIQKRIEENHQEFSFLHDLLRESGPALVKAVEKFLNWLEFKKVVNVDETIPGMKEEDLQVETEEGLLVIEVKGIQGTSSDSECSQISKIRYRRSKERQKHDVSALYLVNHQRFLPPENRKNPPFSEHQISDAVSDERGLLASYTLFKLYTYISNGLISKEDARNSLLKSGLVKFEPTSSQRIIPIEIHYNGKVVVFDNQLVGLRVGSRILVQDGFDFRTGIIEEIRIDDISVEQAQLGEIGIKISEALKKDSILWIRLN